MIDLGTLAGLLEHDHGLAAYCPRCSRWSVLPLARLVTTGKGSLRLPFTAGTAARPAGSGYARRCPPSNRIASGGSRHP